MSEFGRGLVPGLSIAAPVGPIGVSGASISGFGIVTLLGWV